MLALYMPAHYAFNYYAGIFDEGLCLTKSDNVPPTYGHFFACSRLHIWVNTCTLLHAVSMFLHALRRMVVNGDAYIPLLHCKLNLMVSNVYVSIIHMVTILLWYIRHVYGIVFKNH